MTNLALVNQTVPQPYKSAHEPIVFTDKAKKAKQSFKPIRLANTKGMANEDWLEIRKQGIGSSDAPTACGINPYKSMLELWLDKTGRATATKVEIDGYSPLYWGHKLEPLVAQFYQEKTGNKVRRVNAVLQHPESDKSFMLANLDYSVVGTDEVQILECKTTGEHGAKLWREGVPLYVTCQVQHQLAVTGKQSAHVCVLLCGHETRIYQVERDEQLIEQLIELEKQFWHYVETDTPPPADHSKSASQAIKQLYPTANKLSKIDLKTDDTANQLFNELLTQRQLIDDSEKQRDQCKHQLQMLIKDNELAFFNKGSISWKQTKKGNRRFVVYADD